jgi:hypothetical protein
MARADFLERSRRFSFLVMLAVSLYVGYGFLPPNHANYSTLRLAEHRGIYNSAWIGAAIALLTATFVGLVGYYLIKNAVERDRQTRVGQILAATPVSSFGYVLSKVLSNFAVLAAIALAVALSAGVTQLVLGEDTNLQLTKLLAPYLFLTLPSLFFIAAIGAAFECTPGLRGGGGNVAYFFLWTLGIAVSGTALRATGYDYIGFGTLLPSMQAACGAVFADCGPENSSVAFGLVFRESGAWNLGTFVWDGIRWTPQIVARRLVWIFAGLALTFATSLWFDRFGAEAGGAGRRVFGKRKKSESAADASESAPEPAPGFAGHYHVAAIDSAALREVSASHVLRLISAEVRLMLKGASRGWYVVLLGLWIASAVTPLEAARLRVLPLAWIWPVLLWSGMGVREIRFGTDQILFSTPHPLRLQVPAAWLGGVFVAMLAGAVIAVRFLLAGDFGALGAWLVGACFIPALALALGVWTGSSRAFEGLYTAFWYMGPLQPIAPIDFMGASRAAVESGTPLVFAGVTAVLLALAFLGRKRQLQN